MKNSTYFKNNIGFSLVEALLANTLFVIIFMALLGGLIYSKETNGLAGSRIRANLLAEEGLEASKNIRDESFDNLIDGTYGLDIAVDNTWSFAPTPDTTDIFTREINITAITDDIKQVISTVTWQQNIQRDGSVSLTSYLANWQGAEGPLIEATLNLPGNNAGKKVIASGDYAYIIRNRSRRFDIVNITVPNNPTFAGNILMQGNMLDIAIEGNYAYLTSNHNSYELQILNISTFPPTLVANYNLPEREDPYAIAARDSFLYIVRAANRRAGRNEFYIIDISDPSFPSWSSLDLLSGNNIGISLFNNYAYVISEDNTYEIKIIDISNPNSPFGAGYYDMPGNTNPKSIHIFNNILAVSDTNSYVRFFSLANPTLLQEIYAYDAGDAVNAIETNDIFTNLFLATDNNSSEFQKLTIAIPPEVSPLDFVSDITSLDFHPVKNMVFALSEDRDQEFLVISP